MARILIVTAWYYPFIHPRAHRWTSLAEYWAGQGHEVHVLCARRRDCPSQGVLNGVQVHRIGFDSLKELFYYYFGGAKGRGRVGAGAQQPTWSLRLLSWFYSSFWKKIYFPDDACIWYFPARKAAIKILEQAEFDAILTVSLPFTGHLIGRAAKREFPQLHWLADIGDPFTIQAQALNNSFFYGALSRDLEKKVLAEANAVVVTHTGTKRVYRKYFGAAVEKIQIAPPLLHPESIAEYPEQPRKPGSIHLAYFGALYAPVRMPDAFLQLLELSFQASPDLKNRLQTHFYGDVFPEFYPKLSKAAGVQLHGLQSRQTVRIAMQRVDILVNIGNTTDYQLPSKVVDYLAAGKPVLHLSYVDEDPFVACWGTAPGLLVLRVRAGGFSSEEVLRWLGFLENPPACYSGATLHEYLRPFTLSAVAQIYAGLIPALKPARSIPKILEAPAHH